MKRLKGLFAVLFVAALSIGLLAACGHAKSYPSQCTYIVGNGIGDAHKVKNIAYPNETVSINGDEKQWFVPCNARNYVITADTDHGDRHTLSVAYTLSSPGQPSMQINVSSSAYWGLNQNKEALTAFLPFCEKYSCYDTSANQSHNSTNSASPGWNAMLKETFGPAIDRAIIKVSGNFGPDLWSNHADWQKFADELGPAFQTEVKKSWASLSNDDFFCSNVESSRTGPCDPVNFVVDKIEPTDPRVIQVAKDSQLLEQQSALNAKQVAQAKAKYGPDYNQVLGDLDKIAACNSSKNCTVIVGTNSTAVAVP